MGMTLELDGVTKVVAGRTHVHATDLMLERGTMNVLLGPTLSGKTSLMRLMAGLDVPRQARFGWNGVDVTGHAGAGPQGGDGLPAVHQLPESMSVFDNIASPLRLMGKFPKPRSTRGTRKWRRDAETETDAGRLPVGALGRSATTHCAWPGRWSRVPLVLLDEPLANLDYKLREELRVEIPKIFEASGAIFVYATTEPEEALLLGGNTATLWEGRVTQFGPTPSVYRLPADATTARVFSDPPMNFVPVVKDGHRLDFGGLAKAPAEGAHAALPDGRYLAGFRANHVTLNKHSGDAVSCLAPWP
jgi:glycerol transport system ATP-binding protein